MKLLLTTLAICLASFSFAQEDYWDGEDYHHHSSSQKDAASDLMKYIPLRGNEAVLDIGCGDGKITAALSKQLPQGRVVGVDPSQSMIKFAKETFSEAGNLSFALFSGEEIPYENTFDLVVSFTALQWASDHALLIKNVWQSLKPGGVFGVTMPMGLPKGLKAAVEEVSREEKWASYFTNFRTGWNFAEPVSYQSLLQSAGFGAKRVKVVKQEDVFPSLVAFKGFISQWFPYLRPLPDQMKGEFMDSVLDKYLEREPLDAMGRLHFRVDRLEAIAEKPLTL
jgi:trans-aconitate methyltransferase